MATIDKSNFKVYQDGRDRFTAEEYMREREIFRLAINDLEDKLKNARLDEIEGITMDLVSLNEALNQSVTESVVLNEQTVGQIEEVASTVQELRENVTEIDTKARIDIQGVTAALAETRQDLNERAVNAKGWGMKLDGVTDDTLALRNAITYAKQNGFTHVNVPFSTSGIKLSSTISIPSNVIVDFNGSKLKPVSVSDGGKYDSSSALIIVGRTVVETDQTTVIKAGLKNAKISYLSQSADFPNRPLLIRKAQHSFIESCEVENSNDWSFGIFYGQHNEIRYCRGISPKFHTFNVNQESYGNRLHGNYSYGVGEGAYAYDIAATNSPLPNYIYNNTVENCAAVVKGQSAPLDFHNNFVINCRGMNWKVFLAWENVKVNDNWFIECNNIVLGSVSNSEFQGNTIINRLTDPTPIFNIGADNIQNLKFNRNKIYTSLSTTNRYIHTVTTRTGLSGIEINDNEIIQNTGTAYTYAIHLLGYTNSQFKRNKLSLPNAWNILGSDCNGSEFDENTILNGDYSLQLGGSVIVRNNNLRRISLVDYLTCYYTGNKAQVWTNTPENERPQTGVDSPVARVTPRFVGDDYMDSASGKIYKAKGKTNADWLLLS